MFIFYSNDIPEDDYSSEHASSQVWKEFHLQNFYQAWEKVIVNNHSLKRIYIYLYFIFLLNLLMTNPTRCSLVTWKLLSVKSNLISISGLQQNKFLKQNKSLKLVLKEILLIRPSFPAPTQLTENQAISLWPKCTKWQWDTETNWLKLTKCLTETDWLKMNDWN